MSIKLTRDQVIEDLQAIVEEKGEDYVYPHANQGIASMCHYFEDDHSPSCIIGHVLNRHGVDLTESTLNITGVFDLRENERIVDCDDDAMIVMVVAQQLQDVGTAWGACVNAAIVADPTDLDNVY